MAEQNTTTVVAENSEKLDDLDGSARNVSAVECDDIVPSRSKRKREQPKKLDDYEQNTPNTSNSSPIICEESTDENHQISLDELLDKLHTPLATEVSSTASQPPPTVNHWSQPYNDSCVRKYFKMRRRVVSPEEFVVHYQYSGAKAVYERQKSHARGLTAVLDFLEEVTSCVDTTDTELFLPHSISDPGHLSVHRNLFSKNINSFLSQETKSLSTCQDESNFSSPYDRFFGRKEIILHQVRLWLLEVANTVKRSPPDVDETAYVQVFKQYLQVFRLPSIDGKGYKLRIPYKTTQVTSVPDLIIRRDQFLSPYFGVVEVKKMTLVPDLKHAYEEPPNRGILNISGEGPNPSKKRCVNFPSGASSTSAREESDDEVKNQDESDLGGSPLTDSQKLFIEIFFGQLFGHVLALDCRASRRLHWYGSYEASRSPQRLGIGVVGFREVPCVGSHRMNVFMTSELSLLKASDRREINKILLALSTSEPAWTDDDD